VVSDRGLPFPGLCLAIAIAVQFSGAVSFVLGWHTRFAAVVLAGFAIFATSLFHTNFAVESEAHMFAKDIALGGALLCLALRSPGPLSLDHRRSQ
jgi:putative oxidoreductase